MSLRMLAPVSLALFAIISLILIVTSLDGDSSTGESGRGQPEPVRERAVSEPRPPALAGQRTYVVKPGDTLSKIAARTGVTVERLLELNPSVDPHGLVTGQRIKLRE